jgi:hypothetical protein
LGAVNSVRRSLVRLSLALEFGAHAPTFVGDNPDAAAISELAIPLNQTLVSQRSSDCSIVS